MVNSILKIMGLTDRNLKKTEVPQETIGQNQLSLEELETLLTVIGKAELKISGSQFELLYNAIVKLQNQYFKLRNE